MTIGFTLESTTEAERTYKSAGFSDVVQLKKTTLITIMIIIIIIIITFLITYFACASMRQLKETFRLHV